MSREPEPARRAGGADARRVSASAWYAVWLRSHSEQLVNRQLVAKGFETFLPQTPTSSHRHEAAPVNWTPMFPGYVFVRDAFDKRRYLDLLTVPGVVRVLEDGWARLTPLPEREIEALRQIEAARMPVFPCAHLARGVRVRVFDGPLAGVEGFFDDGMAAKGRLVVPMDLLGRSIAIAIDVSDLEPCAAA